MTAATQKKPEGYHTATPYLTITGAAAAIDYYRQAFGAVEVMRLADPGGAIMHAEIRIGDSIIMLSEDAPQWGVRSPQAIGGTACSVMLYVDDVDATYAAAIAAGGTPAMPVENQFYGDRSGSFFDPFGHRWIVSTHVEDVSNEEIARRAAAMFASAGG